MASNEDQITIMGYLTVEPDTNSAGKVIGGKMSKVTQSPPYLQDNQRAIRLAIKIPKSVFAPIANVTVEIPKDVVSFPEVTVEAVHG